MKTLILLVQILLFSGMVSPVHGQEIEGEFALLIYGQNLRGTDVEIELMKNPGLDNHWIAVNQRQIDQYSSKVTERMQLLVITGLSSEEFVGQDIRENYISLRIKNVSQDKADSVLFRGAWAVNKSSEIVRKDKVSQWSNWIRHEPEKLRHRSFAQTVYPKNRPIPSNTSLIEHIELPVRHLKAGLQEIEWLEMLFSR